MMSILFLPLARVDWGLSQISEQLLPQYGIRMEKVLIVDVDKCTAVEHAN
jgi:hypothetical protein